MYIFTIKISLLNFEALHSSSTSAACLYKPHGRRTTERQKVRLKLVVVVDDDVLYIKVFASTICFGQVESKKFVFLTFNITIIRN